LRPVLAANMSSVGVAVEPVSLAMSSGEPHAENRINKSAVMGMNKLSRFKSSPQSSNPEIPAIIFQSSKLSSTFPKKNPTAETYSVQTYEGTTGGIN
jgi:hypothetical protein